MNIDQSNIETAPLKPRKSPSIGLRIILFSPTFFPVILLFIIELKWKIGPSIIITSIISLLLTPILYKLIGQPKNVYAILEDEQMDIARMLLLSLVCYLGMIVLFFIWLSSVIN